MESLADRSLNHGIQHSDMIESGFLHQAYTTRHTFAFLVGTLAYLA